LLIAVRGFLPVVKIARRYIVVQIWLRTIVLAVECDEAIRAGKRQRAKHNRAHHCEQSQARSNADRHYRNCYYAEPRHPQQSAHRILRVSRPPFELRKAPMIADGLPNLL